jgi:hypothetical protein
MLPAVAMAVIIVRCLKFGHARYVGRMHWLGFNTQRITSVRGGLLCFSCQSLLGSSFGVAFTTKVRISPVSGFSL